MTAKNLAFLALFEVLPIFSCVVNNESLNNYIYKFFIILSGFVVLKVFSINELVKYFSKYMTFFCAYSLIIMIIYFANSNILRMLPTINNSLGVTYFNALFCLGQFDTILGLMRNFGIFREPGVFAVFINLAILFEITREKINIKRLVIFIITLITTFSTAGYIVFALIGTYYFLFKKDRKKFMYVFWALSITLTLIYFTGFTDYVLIMFSKFHHGSNSYGSFYARLMSIISNIEIGLKNPIFGIGRYHLYDTNLGTMGNYEAIDNTNTLLINFASFGIIYGLLNIFGLFKFSRIYCENSLVKAFFIFIIVFLLLSNEDMNQNVFYYVLIFAGWGIEPNNKKFSSRKGLIYAKGYCC